MSKYSYLNLNQKMIKIRKKIPSLIRKRYSEEVDYDFVKLDDINQFLTPALNRYGVDFDILSETATQTDASGNPAFLVRDGNLWRYEANLEIGWTNADRPEEKITAVVHLVGTNDVADKAKGTAMTYGLKYYLLNKFNIPQNGADDPDMKGTKQDEKPQKTEPASGKKESCQKAQKGGTKNKEETGFVPTGSLDEGLGAAKNSGSRRVEEKPVRNGNAVSLGASGAVSGKGSQERKIQQIKERKEEETAPKEEKDADKKTDSAIEAEGEHAEQQSFSFLDESKAEVPVTKAGTVPERKEEPAPQKADEPEEEIDFSDEEECEEADESKAAEDGFQPVTDKDEIPFTEETGMEADGAETEDDRIEKAKGVICNFGLYKGHTLGEMLETTKGWESLKWIAVRYMGANKEMKEAAALLVEAGAYEPKAA